MFSIVDIETTGGISQNARIIDLAIVKFDGKHIVEKYETLINPLQEIPWYITRLTGINNRMVSNAPKFSEISEKVYKILDNSIFVAHNSPFDYSFLRYEFSMLDINFEAPTICTVQTSRKLLPKQDSYSLGKLCNSLNIEICNRHRAMGDALATTTLFEHLLNINPTLNQIDCSTISSLLDFSIFYKLPNKAGVFYYFNENNDVIYVGKSKSIRNRVISTFQNGKSKKALQIRTETAKITFQITNNIEEAQVIEKENINKFSPKYNSKSRINTVV